MCALQMIWSHGYEARTADTGTADAQQMRECAMRKSGADMEAEQCESGVTVSSLMFRGGRGEVGLVSTQTLLWGGGIFDQSAQKGDHPSWQWLIGR